MFLLVLSILLLPIASQILLGSFSIAGRIRLPYATITRINSFLEIVLLVASPKLLDVEAKIEHVHRIMPHTTFFTISIFIFLAYICVIVSQLVWKNAEKRRPKKSMRINSHHA